MNTTTSPAADALTDAIESMDSEILFNTWALLTPKMEDMTATHDDRLIAGTIAEVVVARYGIAAEVDAILDADEDFELTYRDAVLRAMAQTAAA